MPADLQTCTPASGVEGDALAGSARRRFALALVLLSGFSALGYQIVWTQQAALWLGHDAPAVLAVVAAFFGGLALGALALGSRVERSPHAARWYAACEALIAAWSILLAFAMPAASSWLSTVAGAEPSAAWHWAVAFGGTFLLLAPATIAMGATLPAMERVLSSMPSGRSSIAELYAANTLGAVVGVLAVAFWLIPSFGLRATAVICAVSSLLCAVLAAWLVAPASGQRRSVTRNDVRPLAVLAVTGCLGIGYEVVAVRVLCQVTENTVYTFALLLAVYLVGTFTGAAAYARLATAGTDARALRDKLLAYTAAASLLGMFSLAMSDTLKRWLDATLGTSMTAALFAEASLAVAAFLPPTIAMGALFSHLCASERARQASFARCLAANTFGAALAPIVFGVLSYAWLGPTLTMLLLGAGYLLLVSRGAWRAPPAWVAAGLLGGLALIRPSLTLIEIPEGGRLVSHQHGTRATVSVVEDRQGVARLHINSRQQEGSNATYYADARQALLPILLHPDPRTALFLGLGTGVTARAAAQHPDLAVDAVELLPEVVQASAHFTRALAFAPSPRVIVADARRYVRTTDARYDIIVADNFHPARSGTASLYTVEHFAAVRDRLAPGGVFCQWLPLHQLDLSTLRSIVQAFLAVYPHGFAVLATASLSTPVVGLVARADGQRFDVDALRSRLARASPTPSAADLGVTDEFALLGIFVSGPAGLATFAGNAPLNTDDRQVVAFGAPRVTYAPDSRPYDRLVAFLGEVTIAPADLGADGAFGPRLAAYWSARNRFLEAGRDVQPSADPRLMLAQVREPLLAVLAVSPDFRPAYEPLLRLALALARSDPRAATSLLFELDRLAPNRAEAMAAARAITAPSR